MNVPFGQKKQYAALVTRVHEEQPSYQTKDILAILDEEKMLLPNQLKLWQWVAEYYMCTLGEVYKAAIPSGLKEKDGIVTYRPRTVDFVRIKEHFTLGDVMDIIATSKRNIFPVIDNFGHLLGIVQLDDLREDMFKQHKWGNHITTYMIQPPDRILEKEQIQEVLPRFEHNHTWMLPVVDKENRYKGFISWDDVQ